MRRVLMIMALLAGLGGSAMVAAQDYRPRPGTTGPQPRDVHGAHAVRGDVARLDRRAGSITVQTERGNLELYFPPASLEALQEGDRLEIQLAFTASARDRVPDRGPEPHRLAHSRSERAPSLAAGVLRRR
jgi:hypothetical protein